MNAPDHRASLAKSLTTIHRIMYDSDCTDNTINRGCNKNMIQTKSSRRLSTQRRATVDSENSAPSFIKQERRNSRKLRRQRSELKKQASMPTSSDEKVRKEKYSLGDPIQCLSDVAMNVASSPELSIEAAGLLRKDDFAFIKRRNGSYTYARLIDCSTERLTFVVCKKGSIKKINRKHWSELIRFVALEVSTARPPVPLFISVASSNDDDCSMISDRRWKINVQVFRLNPKLLNKITHCI